MRMMRVPAVWATNLTAFLSGVRTPLVTKLELVTATVEEITGVAACTFREWAADHADDFR